MNPVGILLVAGLVVYATWWSTISPHAVAARASKARTDSELVCPHCQTYGAVTSRAVVRKKGVSGGKATGALLTGGLSMLLTGLSRKEAATRMWCGNCATGWDV